MRTSVWNYITKRIKKEWRKICFSILISLTIILANYWLGNTLFPLPDEIGVFQKINGWNSFRGNQKGNVPDSLLFINVCYDKMLVDYAENDMPVGQYPITDREKLLKLLTVAKQANNYRYIFLDIIFEEGIGTTPYDSALFHTIASMDRIILPVHENAKLQDSILYRKSANADYAVAWEETNFARYQFLHKDMPSVPLKMYIDKKQLEGTGIKEHGGGLWYTDDGILCSNGVTLLLNVRMTGRFMDTESQERERNFIYLGADLLNIDSIIPIQEQIADKILVIGDFKDDVHDTYIGPQPGSSICVNAYISLMNGDHFVNWWVVIFSFLLYTTVGTAFLMGHSFSSPFKKWPIIKLFVSFISTGLFFTLIAAVMFKWFDIALNIWLPSLIYPSIDAVVQKYQDYKENKDENQKKNFAIDSSSGNLPS